MGIASFSRPLVSVSFDLIVLKLKLFGAAAIERSDAPVSGRAAQGRRMALLAVLALARGRPVTRDRIIALLWPESGAERARPQLSDTLYILRSGLNEDVVRSVGDGLLLNPDLIACDVTQFERLLDEGRPEAAVELFSGPLLDGFHLSDAVEFERWLDTERARLGQRYAQALESLAQENELQNRHAPAASWWRKLAAHDPYSGRVALRLMRALEATGDRAAALQHARVFAAVLRDELDTEPDGEVTAFAERLRREQPVSPAPEIAPAQPAQTQPQNDADPAPLAPPKRPRRVYASIAALLLLVFTLVAVYGMRRPASTGAASDVRSVAVLPFVNMSADPENQYFSDGLSEQIIAALSSIDGLRVAARTSSFALRDRKLDARAIGDALGVATVLEGSVRKNRQRLRVTAQLIDAASGFHVWSKEYDAEMADIVTVQEQIATAIAEALELRFNRSETAAGQRVTNLEAYDLYLRGLYLRNTLSADGLRQAAQFFDRAITLEPGFALAYAAKASVIAPLIYFGQLDGEDGVSQQRVLVKRALELDPTLGEAYVGLGILKLFFDWDWEGAKQALTRAIELNPNDHHAYHHLANYHHAMGQFAEAAAARERSIKLDPLNARTLITLGNDYLAAGDFERALTHHRRALQLDPMNPLALGLGPDLPNGPAEVFHEQGRIDEAAQEYLRIATLRGASADELAALRSAATASGSTEFWRAWLQMDLRQSADRPNSLRTAATWAMIGDTAKTFEWLERALAERNPGLIYVRGQRPFDRLRTHPRMVRIVEAMKFPDS